MKKMLKNIKNDLVEYLEKLAIYDEVDPIIIVDCINSMNDVIDKCIELEYKYDIISSLLENLFYDYVDYNSKIIELLILSNTDKYIEIKIKQRLLSIDEIICLLKNLKDKEKYVKKNN